MNESDRIRWDRKYSDKEPSSEITPDSFLVRSLKGIQPGRALDLGCGFGDNAITLAGAGFEVTAVDISRIGLKRAGERARKAGVTVLFQCSDAEDFDFGDQAYDLITGFYFLNRSIFPRIRKALKPGGIFLCKTYTVDELRYRPELNRAYLLEHEELKTVFGGFEILLYDERDNGTECSVRFLARRT